MENILLSNLEFERDVIIYTDHDINVKTEYSEVHQPIQVNLSEIGKSIIKYNQCVSGSGSLVLNCVQIFLHSL